MKPLPMDDIKDDLGLDSDEWGTVITAEHFYRIHRVVNAQMEQIKKLESRVFWMGCTVVAILARLAWSAQ